MQILTQNYKRNPNELVSSVYSGVAPGNRTVTIIRKPSADRNRMESTKIYGPMMPRGQGGRIAVMVLGGMETTLDEVEYIVKARQEKKFVPQRTSSEIAQMCKLLQDRRNEQVVEAKKRAGISLSDSPKPKKKKIVLHLPVGYKFVGTNEPGLNVAVRI